MKPCKCTYILFFIMNNFTLTENVLHFGIGRIRETGLLERSFLRFTEKGPEIKILKSGRKLCGIKMYLTP